MAKEAKAEAAGTEPPKKNRKLLIIIVALLVLVLAGGGAAAFLLLKKHNAAEGDDEETVSEPVKQSKKKSGKEVPPVYVAMDAFVVNLAPENGEQFMQLVLSAEVEDAPAGEKIKTYTPKIRNNVMLLLSSKKASELLTAEGKSKLAQEIREQMNEILAPGAKGDNAPVKDVLFTSFIIQ